MSIVFTLIRNAATAQAEVPTPLGPLRLVRGERGLLGAWFAGQKHHPGDFDLPERPGDALLRETAQRIGRYFDGSAEAFDLPLDLRGTPFQCRVWTALQRIAPGRTTSYGALAAGIGAPSAVRAVGAAVGRNPLTLIVPCHRVVGSTGGLTGYAGGLDRKRRLLEIEASAGTLQAAA